MTRDERKKQYRTQKLDRIEHAPYEASPYDTGWLLDEVRRLDAENERLRTGLWESVSVIDRLSDEQAMQDDFYEEPLSRIRSLLEAS